MQPCLAARTESLFSLVHDLKLIVLFSAFLGATLHIKMLTAPHVKLLMKTHQVRGSILWFPRFRLQQYANLVHQIDLAILREGKKYSIYLDSKAPILRAMPYTIAGVALGRVAQAPVNLWISRACSKEPLRF